MFGNPMNPASPGNMMNPASPYFGLWYEDGGLISPPKHQEEPLASVGVPDCLGSCSENISGDSLGGFLVFAFCAVCVAIIFSVKA